MPNFSGIWTAAQQFQARGQNIWPRFPGAPTIGTATAGSNLCASVTFTAPTCTGYPTSISSYTVTSTPGCITASGAASPITVTGLTNATSYTFKVKATNGTGSGACSAASNSITASNAGSQSYTSAGSYSWVAPAGVTAVSVVAVGGGASAGGGLGYRNNYSVTPGCSYTVVVGAASASICTAGDSYFVNTSTVRGGGAVGQSGGSYTGQGGGNGGAAGGTTSSGAGGAGGYAGNGGAGGGNATAGSSGSGGAGGGGGGYSGAFARGAGSGGGVGLFGQGGSGSGGNQGFGGGGGSGGTSGSSNTLLCACGYYYGAAGGNYGGGGSRGFGAPSGTGGSGAVRIVWPGNTRSFPSTCVGNP